MRRCHAALLVAQRLADVGQHHQVWGARAAGTACAAPPSARSPRAGQSARSRPARIEPVIHLEVGRVAIEQPLGRSPEQALAGVVDQPQAPAFVEGEDGDVELRHDLAQQRRRLERVEALPAQHLGQGIDLGVQVVERIGAARAARPHREVAFSRHADSRLATVCSGMITRARMDARKPSRARPA